jgi:hypothetical protein
MVCLQVNDPAANSPYTWHSDPVRPDVSVRLTAITVIRN